MPIQLAIVDDDQTLARLLKRELMDFPEIDSIELFSGGFGFVNQLHTSTTLPGVVLMDISMGVADEGIAATRMLHERFPAIKVIMFTVAEDDEHVFEAFKSGAVGYLLKNERPAFIYKTIVDVNNGGALMSPGIALKTIRFLADQLSDRSIQHTAPEDFHLSERELEVLRLVAKGQTYTLMGETLFISTETVKKHMANIFKKLRVKNKIEAINKSKAFL